MTSPTADYLPISARSTSTRVFNGLALPVVSSGRDVPMTNPEQNAPREQAVERIANKVYFRTATGEIQVALATGRILAWHNGRLVVLSA